MFSYLKSLIKPENSFIKILSRIRFITDIILVIITVFILFQLKFFFNQSSQAPAPTIGSFDNFSMVYVDLSNVNRFNTGTVSDALYCDTKEIVAGIFSPLEFFLLNSKYIALYILLLIVFFFIRRLIYSLDQNKSFSDQLISGLNKISKLIIKFSILFIIISILYYYYGYQYFSRIIEKDKMTGILSGAHLVINTDIVIAAFIFFIGVLLNALTKFFRLGFNLQKENDLTV